MKSNLAESINSRIQHSIWVNDIPPFSFSPLPKNITVDAVVVGAGIAGLTVAYYLMRAGLEVAVINEGPVGGEETGRTTAHLVNVLDERYSDLEQRFGLEKTKRVAQAHTIAINEIERIAQEERIRCDFERINAYLFKHPTDTTDALVKELDAAQRVGIEGVQMIPRAPLPFDTGECLFFPHQAQFHSMKYLKGLSRAIFDGGCTIYTETKAEQFETSKIVTSDGHKIHASYIVVCTNSPANDRITIHSKETTYTSYVVGARIPKGTVSRVIFWDTGDHAKEHPHPYHYMRLQSIDEHSDLLIIGGEDHETGKQIKGSKPLQELEQWACDHFPMIEAIDYEWSGQIINSHDSLAFIGRNPGDENTFVVTGDSGNGITYATIAGMLIRDLILGRNNPWATIFDPSRPILHSPKHFAGV